MLYRRRRRHGGTPHGFYMFENQHRKVMCGVGDGDFVRLRDEHGTVWRGQAEAAEDRSIRLIFKDANGKRISGISDSNGVTLRDEDGNTWRGFID